ncbi:unnamed protein product, partial [Polarella glacialis]
APQLDSPYNPDVSDDVAAAAAEAMKSAGGDWGPVFVYGSFLISESWGILIDRVPEMKVGMLRGFVRRNVTCSGFAGLMEEENGIVIGQVVLGLKPHERRLLDAVIEDTFEMVSVGVKIMEEDPPQDVECTTYLFKPQFMDGLSDDDWEMEAFC